MGFIAYIILGLFAGLIAKAIMPGKEGGGWLATILLGVVGAALGGWLGNLAFGIGLENFWSLQTWGLAIVGSLIVLAIWGWLTGKKN